MSQHLASLVRSWELSSDLHSLPVGATSEAIADFERLVGWRLPDEWRRLYAHSNGPSLFEGNLNFYPLNGEGSSVSNSSSVHRSQQWPVPPELWIAGDNGQGDKFGVWVPPGRRAKPHVVALGAIFETGCMAVVGSNLDGFLLARSAYYLQLCEGPPAAMDAIAVPAKLRTDAPGDATWKSMAEWADPHRPGRSDDPYEERLDAASVALLVDGLSNTPAHPS